MRDDRLFDKTICFYAGFRGVVLSDRSEAWKPVGRRRIKLIILRKNEFV